MKPPWGGGGGRWESDGEVGREGTREPMEDEGERGMAMIPCINDSPCQEAWSY